MIITGSGETQNEIRLQSVVDAIGKDNVVALPTIHVFSEADNTGSFTGKEETLFWNAVEHADIYKQHHTSRV